MRSPFALGLGLRPNFTRALASEPHSVGFLELLVENYLGAASLPREQLRSLQGQIPMVGHGVALNLLGSDPLDLDYLSRVRDLIQEFELGFFSDHLCWTAHRGVSHHDLLPAPNCKELVNYVADRAQQVQEYLGVPFGIENISSYVRFERDDLSEWEFYRRVVDASATWYMLDINNVFVNSVNHGFDAHEYLQSVNWQRVLQVHIAGHEVRPDGLRHDTHDRPLCDEVWALYEYAWRLGGPFPTLLEWDAQIPPLPVALAELKRAELTRTSGVAESA